METSNLKGPSPQGYHTRDKENEECIVEGIHGFILWLSSFFGMAALQFEKRGRRYAVSISYSMCIYSSIFITILALITLYGLASELIFGINPYVHMSSRLSQAASCCDITLVVTMAAAGVFGAPRRMRTMLKYMNTIASVDESVGRKYSLVKDRKKRVGVIIYMGFVIGLLVDDIHFYAMRARVGNREWSVISNYIGFYILWSLVIILQIQFAFTVLMVNERFQAINNALLLVHQQISKPNSEKNNNSEPLNVFNVRVPPTKSPPEKAKTVVIKKYVTGEHRLLVSPSDAIQRIASLHGELTDVVVSIGNSYSNCLVLILVSSMFHLIATPYFMFAEIHFNINNNRIHIVILQSLWSIFHMFKLFLVVEPCHRIISEETKTVSLVSRMMVSSPTTGSLGLRLEHFARQLMRQSICFKPMGLCTLDRPVMATILGAVTTYLVILIQFHTHEA